MKISRQWQLRPGPRHLHHNNMQPAVARMGGGREGREALTEYLEYFLIIFVHVQSWSGRSKNEGERGEQEWSIILQYHHSTTESNLSVRCFGKFLEIGLLISVRHQTSLCRASVYPLILCHSGLLLLEISFISQDQDFMNRKYRIYKILALFYMNKKLFW